MDSIASQVQESDVELHWDSLGWFLIGEEETRDASRMQARLTETDIKILRY